MQTGKKWRLLRAAPELVSFCQGGFDLLGLTLFVHDIRVDDLCGSVDRKDLEGYKIGLAEENRDCDTKEIKDLLPCPKIKIGGILDAKGNPIVSVDE